MDMRLICNIYIIDTLTLSGNKNKNGTKQTGYRFTFCDVDALIFAFTHSTFTRY